MPPLIRLAKLQKIQARVDALTTPRRCAVSVSAHSGGLNNARKLLPANNLPFRLENTMGVLNKARNSRTLPATRSRDKLGRNLHPQNVRSRVWPRLYIAVFAKTRDCASLSPPCAQFMRCVKKRAGFFISNPWGVVVGA